MKNFQVTIGISAYNEQSNIGGLIKDLLNQHTTLVTIKKIIIISDGSTDKTALAASQVKNSRLKIIKGRQRKGKAYRQNEIISQTSTDILIFLDADILIKDPLFLEKLVRPIIKGRAEMTSSCTQPISARTFFEKTLFVSAHLKGILYAQFKNGSNIYTCFGQARAFGKNLYKKLNFLTQDGEDMFSYYSCLKFGYKFRNVAQAATYYQLPSNLTDHFKQSTRFHRAQKQMIKYFDPKIIQLEQRIPLSAYLRFIKFALPILFKYPLFIAAYLLILANAKLISKTEFSFIDSWNAQSTKQLRAKL